MPKGVDQTAVGRIGTTTDHPIATLNPTQIAALDGINRGRRHGTANAGYSNTIKVISSDYNAPYNDLYSDRNSHDPSIFIQPQTLSKLRPGAKPIWGKSRRTRRRRRRTWKPLPWRILGRRRSPKPDDWGPPPHIRRRLH